MLRVMTLTVSQVATRAGISADAVRFYEREQLLPPPERSPAGYRLYASDAVDRVRFIKCAQTMGLKLRQVRELLEVCDRGMCDCGHAASIVSRRLAEVETEIAELREMKRELTRVRDGLTADACGWECGCPTEGGGS